jgi:hypothetical protein
MVIEKAPAPVASEIPAEAELKSTDAPKPMAVPITPIEQTSDTEVVQAMTALPKKNAVKEDEVFVPAHQEVKETVKTEPMPTPPVAVIPPAPEVRQEPPAKPEPVKVEERPAEPPAKPEPVKVEERPIEPPIKPKPVKIEERPIEKPVKPEPAKVEERLVELPVKPEPEKL